MASAIPLHTSTVSSMITAAPSTDSFLLNNTFLLTPSLVEGRDHQPPALPNGAKYEAVQALPQPPRTPLLGNSVNNASRPLADERLRVHGVPARPRSRLSGAVFLGRVDPE